MEYLFDIIIFLLDVVCVVDLKGILFFVNLVFEFIFGYVLEEVINR